MKRILVLGAGQSAPYMISYLLDRAEKNDWFITVGDKDQELAKKVILGVAVFLLILTILKCVGNK